MLIIRSEEPSRNGMLDCASTESLSSPGGGSRPSHALLLSASGIAARWEGRHIRKSCELEYFLLAFLESVEPPSSAAGATSREEQLRKLRPQGQHSSPSMPSAGARALRRPPWQPPAPPTGVPSVTKPPSPLRKCSLPVLSRFTATVGVTCGRTASCRHAPAI